MVVRFSSPELILSEYLFEVYRGVVYTLSVLELVFPQEILLSDEISLVVVTNSADPDLGGGSPTRFSLGLN